MKTSVIEVNDMLSVLSVDELEKRIGHVAGVKSVTVNYDAGSATVRYDETRIEVADIKPAVRRSRFESLAPVPAAPASVSTSASVVEKLEEGVKTEPPALDTGLAPPAGLSSAEAARLLAEHGQNEIQRETGTSPWTILAAQFKGAMIWLLLGAAALSMFWFSALPYCVAGAAVVSAGATAPFASYVHFTPWGSFGVAGVLPCSVIT